MRVSVMDLRCKTCKCKNGLTIQAFYQEDDGVFLSCICMARVGRKQCGAQCVYDMYKVIAFLHDQPDYVALSGKDRVTIMFITSKEVN